MTVRIQPFHWEQDFNRVSEFLAETLDIAQYHNWLPSSSEDIRFGPCGTEYEDSMDESIKIWEDGSSSAAEILAVTDTRSPASSGEVQSKFCLYPWSCKLRGCKSFVSIRRLSDCGK